jgi:serine/threonine-protein phosphatase PP1 catalytic subunit
MSSASPPTNPTAAAIINKVMAFGTPDAGTLSEDELVACCLAAIPVLKSQPVMLQLKAPVVICGDIHGQLDDLLRVFRQKGTPPDTPYLFLGDYVDRGDYSIEVMALLLAFKINYPYSIFLLRGNHESPDLNSDYGFQEECVQRFSGTIWEAFNRVFQWLPLCAVVESRIFCVHGGLSQHIKSLDDITNIKRETLRDIPSEGIVCDLTWADPDAGEKSWSESSRGCSFTFGHDIVHEFCAKHGFDFVCRAHQVVDYGYEFFCERKLVTVFTASNYCGDYGNRGSILTVDKDLNCSFVILLPNGGEEAHALQKISSDGMVDAPTQVEADGSTRAVSPPVPDMRAPSPPPSPRRAAPPPPSLFGGAT